MKLEFSNKEELLNIVLGRSKTDIKNVLAVYQYGSRVYGNFNNSSDHDFIVIVKNKSNEQFSDRMININFFTYNDHQSRLDYHEISALEAHFCPDEFVVYKSKEFNPTFKLDLVKLRHSLSAKSSNSFVKAKKKLTVEKDYDLNIGKKSLWHSFRIIEFGIQIASNGTIGDYSSMNVLFSEIMLNYTWTELFENYKQKYNSIVSEFRILAPK